MISIVQKQKYYLGKKVNGFLNISGTRLAIALGLKIFTTKIKPKKVLPNDIIINWGLTSIPWLIGKTYSIINKIEAVKRSSNKLLSFEVLNVIVRTPPYTTSKEEAASWFSNNKTIVFCRTLLSASGGNGIVVARSIDELVDAPLYTLYIRKLFEYRVHIAFSNVIHIQQKRRLTSEQLEERGIIDRESLIRNVDNGYIYSSNLDEDNLPFDIGNTIDLLKSESLKAVEAIGLDFGAVDLVVSKNGKVYVLEVNSAPGIEGTTLLKYKEAFQDKLGI